MAPLPTISPFPWAQLARVDRGAARREAAIRARWRMCDAVSIARELEAVLATSVAVRPERTVWTQRQDRDGNDPPPPNTSRNASPLQERAKMVFSRGAVGEQVTILAEPELLSTLAAWLVARGRRFALPAAAPLDLLQGLGAAVLVELGRRLGAPISARPEGEDEGSEACAAVTLDAVVVIGGRSFPVTVEVTVPESDDLPCHNPQGAWSGLPVTLPLVGAWSLGSLEALLGLTEGDVWMPEAGWHLDGTGGGRAALISPNATRGPWVDLAINGRVVLRDDWAWAPEEVSVTENDDGSQASPVHEESMAELIADTPVVVRVEVGAATLPVRQWLALECGDVLSLEKPIGSSATLRVAGHAVAEGELVNVDGQLGVRIRRLLTNEASA